MKGTDCTPEQLAAASDFLSLAGNPLVDGKEEQKQTCRRSDLVRLLAWYGALRYIAGKTGEGGTLEKPGILNCTKPRA